MSRYLIDVNVLIALLTSGHAHSRAALAWLAHREVPGSVCVCRVVEMGALRLLTRRAVMGDNVLTPTDFWRGWDEALTDERLVRVPEPPGLTGRWRALCAALPAGACADTDVYLAALAVAGDFTLVTFDHGFARFAGLQTELLG